MLKENSSVQKYRNKKDLSLEQNLIIDAGALWLKKDNKLVLVDDDNYVETDLDPSLFEELK